MIRLAAPVSYTHLDVYKRQLYNCEIEIIDNTEKSEQKELVEDLVQIITVFSCKLQGKPANKAKKLIRELIQEEADGKSHKSNVAVSYTHLLKVQVEQIDTKP